MKIIELYTVTFLDWKGILLTDSKPSVEATEENIEKLRAFIENNILRVYDPEVDPEPPYENPFEPYMQPIENPFTSGEYDLSQDKGFTTRIEEEEEEEEAKDDSEEEVLKEIKEEKNENEENKKKENKIEEEQETEDDLKGSTEEEIAKDFSKWKKKQLEEKLTQLGVGIPSGAKKEQLIELIEKTLKEKEIEI